MYTCTMSVDHVNLNAWNDEYTDSHSLLIMEYSFTQMVISIYGR